MSIEVLKRRNDELRNLITTVRKAGWQVYRIYFPAEEWFRGSPSEADSRQFVSNVEELTQSHGGRITERATWHLTVEIPEEAQHEFEAALESLGYKYRWRKFYDDRFFRRGSVSKQREFLFRIWAPGTDNFVEVKQEVSKLARRYGASVENVNYNEGSFDVRILFVYISDFAYALDRLQRERKDLEFTYDFEALRDKGLKGSVSKQGRNAVFTVDVTGEVDEDEVWRIVRRYGGRITRASAGKVYAEVPEEFQRKVVDELSDAGYKHVVTGYVER